MALGSDTPNQNVPLVDALDNVNIEDVIGNKNDTIGGSSIVAIAKNANVNAGAAYSVLTGVAFANLLASVPKKRVERASAPFVSASHAMLTCGIAGTANFADYAALTNTGAFNITIDGGALVSVTPVFTLATDMATVAGCIQAALQAAMVSTPLCSWNGSKFIITSPTVGIGSTITVLSAPGAGVDIAGAGFMNGKVGAGVAVPGAPGRKHLASVAGGKIKVWDIIGEVTAQIQNKATVIHFVSLPTHGTPQVLCADKSIQNDTIGSVYAISGTFVDLMKKTDGAAQVAQAGQILVSDGTIDVEIDNDATGMVKWTVIYEEVDSSVVVS